MNLMNNSEQMQRIFPGAIHHSGQLGNYNPTTETKSAWQEPIPFNWDLHLSGKKIQGLSPVNEETREVSWYGCDIDLKIKPKEFCGDVYSKIDTSLICFGTMGGKWRVVKFLSEPIDVEVAHEKAKLLEEQIEKILKIKCDSGHTLPSIPEKDKPGSWWFMPYHNDLTCAYSPGGRPLSLKQFFFRWKYRDHKCITAMVGMVSPGRHKALWVAEFYKKISGTQIDLAELNENFGEKFVDPIALTQDINHVIKTVEKEQYDKKYYLNGLNGWIEEFCGVKPENDAKAFVELSNELVESYYYVRENNSFYETKSGKFVSQDKMNAWWKHTTGKENMSNLLLKSPKFKKVVTYLTHAGMKPGIVQINFGDIPGVDPGEYLNVYTPSTIVAKKGDVSKLNEYYEWFLGKDNWYTIKQVLAFMLKEPGVKVMWFVIIISRQGGGKGTLAEILQALYGYRNVKPNVRFKDLTNTHSTVIDGAQLICLNEVALTDSQKDVKELSEDFKNLITDKNLIINRKFCDQVEIPNLCNFFVFSNSEEPLHLEEDDRRAFVVNVAHDKAEIKFKLLEENFKEEVRKHIEDPSAFKWHLENEVEYDREMFFNDPPINDDKTVLIEKGKTDFERLLLEAYESRSFPFGDFNAPINDESYYYSGMINRDHFLKFVTIHPNFKGLYKNLNKVDRVLKKLCTRWPNGEFTRTILKDDGPYKRKVYLIDDFEFIRDGEVRKLSTLNERELGKIFECVNPKIDHHAKTIVIPQTKKFSL